MPGSTWDHSTGRPRGRGGPRFDASVPHPARVYNYLLGGKDNFAADRTCAGDALALAPQVRDYAVANRQFLIRAVRFLVSSGTRQFLDLGTGLPTCPNVHEAAQVADPGARVAYVDSDPMVAAHGRALLASDPGVRAFRADFRDASAVLRKARELLDFASPVAIMFVASLHHLEDEDDPADVVAWYLQAAAPGSYLVLSHCTDDIATEGMRAVAKEARRRSATFVPRGRDAIWRMFNGCPLVEPGLVQVSYWRPDGLPGPDADRVPAYGGIARL